MENKKALALLDIKASLDEQIEHINREYIEVLTELIRLEDATEIEREMHLKKLQGELIDVMQTAFTALFITCDNDKDKFNETLDKLFKQHVNKLENEHDYPVVGWYGLSGD